MNMKVESNPESKKYLPKILIVDDDAGVLDSIVDIFTDEFQVTGVQSPSAGLKIIEDISFDILIADLKMREMNGIELIRAAKVICPEIISIIMTGYASKDAAIGALKEGVYDFLEKPFSTEVIYRTVTKAWEMLSAVKENQRLILELKRTNEKLKLTKMSRETEKKKAQILASAENAMINTLMNLENKSKDLSREIKERIEAEEKLKTTLTALEHSNKELKQFAYVASHDLQEPLRMVSSYLQLIKRRYNDKLDSDAVEFIDFAVDGAKRMHRLINDLLEYSRITRDSGKLKPVETGSVLRDVLDNLKISIEESGARITSDELPTVIGDRTQLVQLFQNLIGNALKFRNTENPKINISVKLSHSEENTWIFKVTDNGIGIDPSMVERIFVIFKRLHTREKYEGTGIGLAICKKIVEQHDGKIWVESEIGKGSAFCFSLKGERKVKLINC
ncbi:MAG: ATP-binding protein [bacterium]